MAKSNTTTIPYYTAGVLAPGSNQFTEPWYRFFNTLLDRSGGNGGNGNVTPAQSIQLAASPYVYRASVSGYMIVAGNGVAKTEISRDGATWYHTGSNYGQFALAPGDRIRITYPQGTPLMTYFTF